MTLDPTPIASPNSMPVSRLQMLMDLSLTDPSNPHPFDLITQLAVILAATPYASFTLVDDQNLWHRAQAGFDGDPPAGSDLLCRIVAQRRQSVEIEDLLDERPPLLPAGFSPPAPRFFYGLPVNAPDGRCIGALSVFDTEPRRVWPHMREGMKRLVQLAERELELRARSVVDPLTGLFNRRYLEQRLDEEWRRAARLLAPVTLMMIDIDAFKPFNDTLGHPAGDQALRRVAHALRQQMKRPGDMLARYGGEEFVAVLSHTDLAGARVLAERLRQSVAELAIAHPRSSEPVLTASIGHATWSYGRDCSVEELTASADRALYVAKNRGRNRCVAFEDLDPV